MGIIKIEDRLHPFVEQADFLFHLILSFVQIVQNVKFKCVLIELVKSILSQEIIFMLLVKRFFGM